MKHVRILPLLVPLLVYGLFELYFFNHTYIYAVLIVIDLLIIITLWLFTKNSLIDKNWWNYTILPIFFSNSIIAYSILLTHKNLIQWLFLLNVILLYFYLRFCFYYLLKPLSYKVASIENISSYANFITFFLSSATIYGLQSYLNITVWPLILVMSLVTVAVFYQILWSIKVKIVDGLIYLIIGTLVLIELAWSISFLPLTYNVSGLILAICYYVLIGLVKLHLQDTLETNKVRLYLSFGFFSILLILLTARWI